MAKIVIKNLTKVYENGTVAVKNLSLEVFDNEFLVLLGPSGCGKSTILRLIAGLEEPTEGEIFINDICVNDIPAKDRNIAMVFQNYPLYPHMTVYNNIAFPLKLRGYSKEDIKKKIDEVAEILEIKHIFNRKPNQLSGGERQRVALAKAIVRKPVAFLFDEPLSNLDTKLRMQMRMELHKFHSKVQATVVYVTHDQLEAMSLGNRIGIIREGKLIQLDTPLNIYNKPINKFVAAFVGFPTMNFINGKIITKNDDLYFFNPDFKLKIPTSVSKKLLPYINREIILGIRPEDIHDRLFSPPATAENTILALCEVVETVGTENYLYFSVGKQTFTATVKASSKASKGSLVEVVFDVGRAHFFDPITEDAIV